MPGHIQSLSRAAAVLRLLATGERRYGLTDTAVSLGLPKGTVHGILRTLQQEGLVEHDTESGTYQLGPELVRLGGSYLRTHELRTRALAWADDLARATGEAVHVGVPHPAGVLIVHHVFRRDDTRQVLETGRVLSGTGTALGTVLAGHRSRAGDASSTQHEVPRVVREADWACAPDPVRHGMMSVAAPVCDRNGTTVAAVSVTGIATRVRANTAVRDRLVSSVRSCARAISYDLGADHP
ncbi:IclR family transcriptional regulator [Streptomyces sp. NBC_00078]|uniref:IclR family transcriptional regulator n=1 Tax=unclassified Streptomyces TaxID=2593676 RepID=UPI00224E98D3|nr:IclR family transcriptional regulator [Streptomyces sp. NBC_00078]MCX5418137.1 IclR family transcriptional regulator [Streptomyces sp. NBC_00078]